MAEQVQGATIWHANADEPSVLDYNEEYKSPGHVASLYASDAYRSSDHDPVIVELKLSTPRLLTTYLPLALKQ
jgi:predicted extracellular nuclease